MKFPRHPRHGHIQSSQGSSRSSDDAKVSGMRSWCAAWASPYIRPGASLEEQPQPAGREGLLIPRLLAAAHEQRGLVPEGAFHPGLQGEPFDREVTGGSPQITFAHVRHIPSHMPKGTLSGAPRCHHPRFSRSALRRSRSARRRANSAWMRRSRSIPAM